MGSHAHERPHDAASFEDERWRTFAQPREFRHDAALALITDGPVLDIGCGDGLLLSLLKERGIEAEGIDISPEAAARCTELGLTARTYDPAQTFPFPDGAFETVVLLDVLEHVYDPVALLKEAARVSRAAVIVGVPNFSSLPARIQVLFGRVPENNQPNKGHVYWFNDHVLHGVARSAGLEERRRLMNTFRPFAWFGEFFPRLAPGLFALSFVARFER